MKKDMIQGFATFLGSLNKDFNIFNYLFLSPEIIKANRPQGPLKIILLGRVILSFSAQVIFSHQAWAIFTKIGIY